MTIGKKHWLAALAVALLAHASLLFLLWEPTQGGAANLGVGGINVSFGMAGGAPGAGEVLPPVATPVEALDEIPVEPVQDAVEEIPVEPVQDSVEETEFVETAEVQPIVAEAVEAVEVKPKTKKTIVEKGPKPREVREVQPKRLPVGEPPAEVAAREPQPETTKASVAIAGAAGKSGTQQSANVGAASSMSSGGRPGSSASYFVALQAWLEKHKEYPTSARRRRHQGTVMLAFTIDRRGHVLAARITRSAGHASLDKEVMNMIRRADPLPPFPDDFSESQIRLVIPVQFQLF